MGKSKTRKHKIKKTKSTKKIKKSKTWPVILPTDIIERVNYEIEDLEKEKAQETVEETLQYEMMLGVISLYEKESLTEDEQEFLERMRSDKEIVNIILSDRDSIKKDLAQKRSVLESKRFKNYLENSVGNTKKRLIRAVEKVEIQIKFFEIIFK